MNSFLIFTLVAHIILGLIAIAALYAVWMGLLKKRLAARFLAWSAWISAISFFLSWLSGGYYYVVHYGKAVKPLIKAGPYPWAHTVVMEAKEHIFLFLPFCALVIALAISFLGPKIEEYPVIRRALAFLTGIAVFVGIAITLSGVLISGAAR